MSLFNQVKSRTWMNLTMFHCLLAFPPAVMSQTATSPPGSRAPTTASQQVMPRSQQVLQHSQRLVSGQQRKTAEGTAVKNFTGTYRLVVNTNRSSQRVNAIDNAVAGMERFKQGRAREMLKKKTAPPKELRIADSGTQIKLGQSGGEITVPTNGQAVTVKGNEGRVALRAGRRDGKLIVVSKTANATNTTVYDLSADGQILTQQIQIQSDKLPSPIQFTNSFRR